MITLQHYPSISVIVDSKYKRITNPFTFSRVFFLGKTVFGLSDQILLAKIFLQQLQFVRQVSEEVNGTSVLYHRQQFQNVYFLMWNVLQQQYWHYFPMMYQSFFFLNTFYFRFPQTFLIINSTSFFLDSWRLESSGSFHFVSNFLAIFCLFYRCW